jgi:hypothetical protein
MTYPYSPNGLTGQPFFTPTDLAYRMQTDPTAMNSNAAILLAQLASDAVREEIRQKVDYTVGDTVTLYGDNGEVLLLPERPVVRVSSVVLAGVTLSPTQVNTTTNMLMFDARPDGSLRRVVYGGSFYAAQLFYKWPLGVPVTVTYDHGYQVVPSVMVHVALELAAAAYSNPQLHESERVGWVEWTTRRLGLDMTAEQRTSLDVYRNVSLTI